nr:hypothetical protein [Paludisphaera mucosa]
MWLDPEGPSACRSRGDAWSAKREYERAVADYTEAIRRKPTDYFAYEGRGVARSALKLYDRAIADFDEVVRLNADSCTTSCRRGDAWRGAREYGLALAEYDRVIADYSVAKPPNGPWAWPYLSKAVVRLVQGRAEAVADARAAIEAEGWRGEHALRAALVGGFGARRAGMGDEGRRFLDEAAEHADASAWPFPIVRFLRREIDEPALLALAADRDERAEASCWLGYDHLFEGRGEEAREDFRRVVGHGSPLALETFLAEAELERLD